MNLRGENILFRAAVFAAVGSFALMCSTLGAVAADDTTDHAPLPSGLAGRTDVVAMAPIPDYPSRAASNAPEPTSSRLSMIVRDGTVTMIDPEHISLMGRTEDTVESVVNNALIERSGDGLTPVRRGETNCLAKAIYFEARGESTKGQEAVAAVVLARTKARGRPHSVCGVVYEGSQLSTGCQFSFTCDGTPDVVRNGNAWARAERIAARAMHGKFKSVAHGATYFHASYVRPRWASHMTKVATIGTHVFYRP